MAAITIEQITEGGIGTSATSVDVTAPTTVNAGDLLIFGASIDGSTNITMTENTTSDWTELDHVFTTGGSVYVFYLICDGSEDSETWTFDLSEAETCVYEMIRLSGWHGTTPPEMSADNAGTSDSPDPLSVTASWGAGDENLFIAFAGINGTSFTAGPSGYSNFGELDSSTLGGSGSISVAIATRSLNAASENPGTFTATVSDDWGAYTVVVRPASSSGLSVNISPSANYVQVV